MSARHFPEVDGQHVWIHSKALGHRAALERDDGRRYDTIGRYPSELEALQALRSELTEAHDRRVALIDAAIMEMGMEAGK